MIQKATSGSLNIKDPEANRLAREIARETGQSLTEVITEALRDRSERLQRRRRKATLEELMVIARQAAAHVKRPYVNHGELLYDEDGLPK